MKLNELSKYAFVITVGIFWVLAYWAYRNGEIETAKTFAVLGIVFLLLEVPTILSLVRGKRR